MISIPDPYLVKIAMCLLRLPKLRSVLTYFRLMNSN